MEGLTHLLAAVESFTFLPSKDAKCCSRASRRLLGACCDRKPTVSKYLRDGQRSWSPHRDHRGQWGVEKIKMRKSASNPDVEAEFQKGWSHIEGIFGTYC